MDGQRIYVAVVCGGWGTGFWKCFSVFVCALVRVYVRVNSAFGICSKCLCVCGNAEDDPTTMILRAVNEPNAKLEELGL